MAIFNSPPSWPGSDDAVRIARFSPRCTVLGPGVRAVLWVQGCPLRCRECVVPEFLPFAGGEETSVAALARQILDLPDIEGVTLSGGEPFSQARALVRLIEQVRAVRDLSFMSYTGHTLEGLTRWGTDDQHQLLARLDVLVDGPYLPEQHTDLKWRGSANQRVLLLSPRHEQTRFELEQRGNWLEFEFPEDGSLRWIGIPPRGFRTRFAEMLRQQGIDYTIQEDEQ